MVLGAASLVRMYLSIAAWKSWMAWGMGVSEGIERIAGDGGGAGGVREYFTAEGDVIVDEDVRYVIE